MNPDQARPSPKCFKILENHKNNHEKHPIIEENLETRFEKSSKILKTRFETMDFSANFGAFSLRKSL